MGEPLWRAVVANWFELRFSMAGAAAARSAMVGMMAALVNILMVAFEQRWSLGSGVAQLHIT